MGSFIDPRTHPAPGAQQAHRTTTEPNELEELDRFCRQGRLYEVEAWIKQARPLQLGKSTPLPRGRWKSALQIALNANNHSLLLLLLCNGYDQHQEPEPPINLALRARRLDLLDLFLDWGADPHQVDLYDLFATYDSDVFERFRAMGVDLTADHALARTLSEHTSNKPLFGYAKRHLGDDPAIQLELDIALAHHAREGNAKGVALCRWAGADPRVPVPDLRYWDETDDEDEDLCSAMCAACLYGNVEILRRLGPDPSQDDFEQLFRWADASALVELLNHSILPQDVGRIIHRQASWLSFGFRYRRSSPLEAIQRLFEAGARWREYPKDKLGDLRRDVLKTSDRDFVDLLKLLATDDYCSTEILTELTRTPAMRSRMKEVGFIPATDKPNRRSRCGPALSRAVLTKCSVVLPKPPEPPLPSTVRIGPWRRDSKELRMQRAELFERVWSEPRTTLAKEWGLSGTGLSKACQRLKIPLPSRGYWAKARAGKPVGRRPRLPKLPAGQAEEIVVHAPKPDADDY